jgi:hypothetical protein
VFAGLSFAAGVLAARFIKSSADANSAGVRQPLARKGQRRALAGSRESMPAAGLATDDRSARSRSV